jgi:hypothetical protein
MKPRSKTSSTREADELDSLNASLRSRSSSRKSIRRLIEADIEAKAKKRRASESKTSSGWKK